MTHTKCPRCGLVNWLTPEVCERCGLPLHGDATQERGPESARPGLPPHTLGSDLTTGLTSGEPQAPPVWKWYVAFCIVMAVMWLGLVILGLGFISTGPPNTEMSPQEAKVMGLIFVGLGVALAAPYVAAPFLPRRRWAWVVGIVLIVFSMSGTCCLPAAVPLLVFWVRPENKAFFGVGGKGRKGE